MFYFRYLSTNHEHIKWPNRSISYPSERSILYPSCQFACKRMLKIDVVQAKKFEAKVF